MAETSVRGMYVKLTLPFPSAADCSMYCRSSGWTEPGFRLTISTYSSPGSRPTKATLRTPFLTVSLPVWADSRTAAPSSIFAPLGTRNHVMVERDCAVS